MFWGFYDVSVKHCHKIPSSCHILLDHPPLSQHWHHHVSYFPRPVAGTSWWRHSWMFPKAQKQLVLFDNIYGQHSEKRPYKPRLWVKFLSILAYYDESIPLTILHIIVAWNIVLKWLFLMLTICVTKQDKRGVCHGIVVFLCFFEVKLPFLKYFLEIYI